MTDIINECMKKQAIINIGMIGHVANGKSTLTKQLTGKSTQQHSSEKQNNITIQLGYANAKIYYCEPCDIYKSVPSNIDDVQCVSCDYLMELVNHVSFVDCPGHNSFTSNMLNGSSIMDTTILIESANNVEVLGRQSKEHLNAIQISNIPNAFVCINKLDLIKKDVARDRIIDLIHELKKTPAEHSDIIPISANFGSNIDIIARYLANLEIPQKSLDKSVKMIIIRSFNINKINTTIDNISGGIVGGTIVQGVLNIGDKFIIKPGFITKNPQYNPEDETSKKWKCYPLVSVVTSINADTNKLDRAISGGLIGVCSSLDPSLTVSNKLVGNVLSEYNQLNDIYETFMIEFNPLDDTINLNKGDNILLNHNACNTNALIYSFKKKKMVLELLDRPMYAEMGDRITLSQNLNGFKIIGYGIIIKGFTTEICYSDL
jgi:translation initiation factor 2 subunit 3